MAEDAAQVEAELDRLGGKTQLIQTVGERVFTCHATVSNRMIQSDIPSGLSKVPPSVFEVARNPNGVVAPIVAQDMPMFDDAELLGNPPAYDEFNFDFLLGIPQMAGTGTQQQPGLETSGAPPSTQQGQGQRQGQVDFSQIQNFDFISDYLNASGGVVPQGPQPQNATEPVPNPADMDATWQVLVQQLGLGI